MIDLVSLYLRVLFANDITLRKKDYENGVAILISVINQYSAQSGVEHSLLDVSVKILSITPEVTL